MDEPTELEKAEGAGGAEPSGAAESSKVGAPRTGEEPPGGEEGLAAEDLPEGKRPPKGDEPREREEPPQAEEPPEGEVLPPAALQTAEGRERFSAMYRLYEPRLRGFFRKRLIEESELPELTQRTLLRVYLRGGRFANEKARDGFVLTVAENVRKDWLEERRRIVGLELGAGSSERGELAASPPRVRAALRKEPDQLSDLLERERQEALAEAIRSLPPKMRRCVFLRVYQERTYAEIAELLRTPLNTVKSHLAQAKARLRELLGRKLGEIDF